MINQPLTVPINQPLTVPQDINWTYIRRSEIVLDVFWTSYVRSIYILCPGGTFLRKAFIQGRNVNSDILG